MGNAINDRGLARIYCDHHAQETDRRSVARLITLMHKAREHDRYCTIDDCPLSLRSFLQGDVVVHTAINEKMLEYGYLERDDLRQKTLQSKFVVRIYFPQTKQTFNGILP